MIAAITAMDERSCVWRQENSMGEEVEQGSSVYELGKRAWLVAQRLPQLSNIVADRLASNLGLFKAAFSVLNTLDADCDLGIAAGAFCVNTRGCSTKAVATLAQLIREHPEIIRCLDQFGRRVPTPTWRNPNPNPKMWLSISRIIAEGDETHEAYHQAIAKNRELACEDRTMIIDNLRMKAMREGCTVPRQREALKPKR